LIFRRDDKLCVHINPFKEFAMLFKEPHSHHAEVQQAQPATLSQLAERINAEHEATEATAKASIQHARIAGELLLKAKAQVGHGNWLPWIRENCKLSERTARDYMKIADQWHELANRQRAADLSLRGALHLLTHADETDDLDALPFHGRLALDTGVITEPAARHLLRLNVFNQVATLQPKAQTGFESWADHQAKLILWRPRFAHTEEKIAFEVDSALFDLQQVKRIYAHLPIEEAAKLAEQNLLNPDWDEQGLCGSDYWWAKLWLNMKPDFSRLSEADLALIHKAAVRYCASA
jgi:hypothetical protein